MTSRDRSARPDGHPVPIRRIALNTTLAEPGRWILLCIPSGWTDQQVLRMASETLPTEAFEELAERIACEADGADGGGAP